jgi:hypothetical protein
VGLRAGVDDMEKRKFLPPTGLDLRPLGRPASSQSLYRLRYPVWTGMDKIKILPLLGLETQDCGPSSVAIPVLTIMYAYI